jgi:hypothetical protein
MSISTYTGDKQQEFLRALGYDDDVDLRNQLGVFIHAQFIHQERTKLRGHIWAQFDEHDAFHHVRSKAARIGAMLQDGSYKTDMEVAAKLREEVLDLINYGAFLFRHVTGGGWVPKVERSTI